MEFNPKQAQELFATLPKKTVVTTIGTQGDEGQGLERSAVRADLDSQLPFVNNVCALPEALSALERGVPGR